MKPLVVAHCTPFYRDIEGDVVAGSVRLALQWEALTPSYWRLKANTMRGSPVMHTRNKLVKWALEDQGIPDERYRADEKGPPADILLWQDSDVKVTPERLVELVKVLEAAPPDVGAVAAPCVLQSEEGDPAVNVNFVNHADSIPLAQRGEVVECTLAGFGCIATRAEVYRAIGFPWFLWRYGASIEEVIGEDMGWCEKARLAGFSIFVHGGLRAGHVFPREFTLTAESEVWVRLSKKDPKEG